jgi:histidine triad (HIT) family protein
MDDCLFCKIIKKEIPSKILYEDDDILVFMDAFPNVEGHTLVVPKKHYTDIFEVDDETLCKMFKIARIESKDIMTKLDKASTTFLFNYGEDQAIKHLHLHILPNYIKREKIKKTNDEIYEILKG